MTRFLLPLLLLPLALAAPGTGKAADGTGKAPDGKALYTSTCVACHAANGKGAFAGVPDLGPRMAKSDAELIKSTLTGFKSKGSSMAMPAKGGNPKLTAADAAAVVVYLRKIIKPRAAAKRPR